MNKPNKLYIKKPEVTEADVYYISQQENDIEQRDNTDVSLSYVQKYDNDTSRNINNIRHEVSKEYTSDTDLNETEYIKTENNDTNALNDTSKSFRTTLDNSGEMIPPWIVPLLEIPSP